MQLIADLHFHSKYSRALHKLAFRLRVLFIHGSRRVLAGQLFWCNFREAGCN
jgi:hypothetical protein